MGERPQNRGMDVAAKSDVHPWTLKQLELLSAGQTTTFLSWTQAWPASPPRSEHSSYLYRRGTEPLFSGPPGSLASLHLPGYPPGRPLPWPGRPVSDPARLSRHQRPPWPARPPRGLPGQENARRCPGAPSRASLPGDAVPRLRCPQPLPPPRRRRPRPHHSPAGCSSSPAWHPTLEQGVRAGPPYAPLAGGGAIRVPPGDPLPSLPKFSISPK